MAQPASCLDELRSPRGVARFSPGSPGSGVWSAGERRGDCDNSADRRSSGGTSARGHDLAATFTKLRHVGRAVSFVDRDRMSNTEIDHVTVDR